ncbi:reverse transcriptase domain-containing protein [Tanacetum coccineum]
MPTFWLPSRRDEMPQNTSKSVNYLDIWGIDFMGPFPKSHKFEYILVAIEYVFKWVEAEALPTNDARVVINFLKKLFSRFGIPKALISDRGEKQFLQLHELNELRLQAYKDSKLYKARTKAYHDRKLRIRKEFKAGDKVLLYNSKYKFKAPKLRSKCNAESTINEYLTKVRDDSGPGIVRPLFKENIKFEFWGQCINELKDNVFLGNDDENPLEHISNITSIINLFQSPGVSSDQKADFMGPIPRMTPTAEIKAINELSKHSLSWYKEEEYKENDFDKVLRHINDFEHNISVLNEEVRMVQHQYKTPNDERDSLLEETISSFVKKAHWMQKKSENFVWRIKRNYDRTFKNQASAIKTIK